MKGSQLVLPVRLQQDARFENFFVGPNADAVDALLAVAEGKANPGVWLYGAAFAGKSHLLGALRHLRPDMALYTAEGCTLDELTNCEAEILAIDDVEQLLQRSEAEHCLMRLIDARRAREQLLVLSAGVAPSRLEATLPDLRSRFEALAIIGLRPLRDQDRRELLDLHARARGLVLPEDAVQWLLAHLRRDAGTLISALEELDEAALRAQRRPTLRFVQQALRERVQPSLALENEQKASG